MNQSMGVQLPAFCPLSCAGCRTIAFNRKGNIPGNLERIKGYLDTLKCGDSLFITSTGEPGYCEGYDEMVSGLITRGVEISVCCSNKKSLVKGLIRAEISRSDEQDKTSRVAIEVARGLGIPYVATVVNFGEFDNVSFDELRERFDDPDGIIIREAQSEGAAIKLLKEGKIAKEQTRIWRKEGVYLGKVFPMACFHEFHSYKNGIPVLNIDHMGNIVEWLGGDIEAIGPQAQPVAV